MEDQFGKGRLSIIKELRVFLSKEMVAAHVRNEETEDTHKRATNVGMTRAFRKVLQNLHRKEKRTIEKLKENE
jgi:RecA/RadA recombinase